MVKSISGKTTLKQWMNIKLKHIIKKKNKFWGKEDYLFRFYEAQEILLREIIMREK